MSSVSNDPLYHDVRPEYERYTRLFLILAGLICLIGVICSIVKAQDEKRFYIIIVSLVVSMIFTFCIHLFFKRRILLAEKLWFVNLTIVVLFLHALIYSIFVFMKPYPTPPTTTMTTRRTTPFTTTPFNTTNTTNMTNITTTTHSTTTTKKYQNNFLSFPWSDEEIILTKLYELVDGEMN